MKKRSNDLPKWKDKTSSEKILSALGYIISAIVIILAGLNLSDILPYTMDIIEPLLGIMMFIYFLQYRKYNKLCSNIYLGGAVFILICFIIVLVL